ncbi:MAG TPA: hypothetical protein VL426_01395 [Candidatus Binatia bacterium]|jgi:hypothetical protein|nr:hypothetical protein [Candidatus Binatia bacterium]
MRKNGNIFTREARRGGGTSVAPLFVAGVLCAAAVIAATRMFLVPRDTIAAFVPANAVLYAHADGRAASEALLSTSSQLPAGVHPDEVAVFIVPGDDAPRHGTMLAWRAPFRPSEEERRILGERGADALDDRHYLVHDGTLDTAARVAMAAHASFADDRGRRRALALLRSAFPVQIYAVPASLLPSAAAETLAGLQDEPLGAIVGGITLRNGSFMARLMKLETAASRRSLFGYRASAGHADRPGIERIDADVAVAEMSPSIDLSRVLLGAGTAAEGTDRAMLAEAGVAFRAALSSPYALWLNAAGGRTSSLAWFPGVAPKEARRITAGYYAAAHPDHAPFALPDGDAAIEYRLNAPIAAADDNDAVIGSGDARLLVGSDGVHGSLIATDPSLLAAFRDGSARGAAPTPCPTGPDNSLVRVKEPAKTLAPWPKLAGYATTYGIHDLTLGLTVDNEVVICGYTGSTVDNLGG